MDIQLTVEQRAKLDLIGVRAIRLTKSIYYKDKFFIADENGGGRIVYFRNKVRDMDKSPFACFKTFEEAILAMLDTSGDYYWG